MWGRDHLLNRLHGGKHNQLCNKLPDCLLNRLHGGKLGNSTDIVLLSGRDESCRKETEEWLTKNGICYQELHMRPEGDFRKDTVIKREMFDKYIAGKYYVKAVFDDRPCVVRMWRSMGFTTFALGNQHIEF